MKNFLQIISVLVSLLVNNASYSNSVDCTFGSRISAIEGIGHFLLTETEHNIEDPRYSKNFFISKVCLGGVVSPLWPKGSFLSHDNYNFDLPQLSEDIVLEKGVPLTLLSAAPLFAALSIGTTGCFGGAMAHSLALTPRNLEIEVCQAAVSEINNDVAMSQIIENLITNYPIYSFMQDYKITKFYLDRGMLKYRKFGFDAELGKINYRYMP